MSLENILDPNLYKRFRIALQLNNETEETVITSLVSSYVLQTFSKEASLLGPSAEVVHEKHSSFFGMANHKIPKWASKPAQINHKIVRAYLQLAQAGQVRYETLAACCNDKVNRPDVYVPTFTSNFAQMKFDGEKSHGKVFEVDSEGIVTIWPEVAQKLSAYQKDFLFHTTDIGYINRNRQMNMGKTDQPGSDHLQYLYQMKCALCGHQYYANGSDIFLKKCPACQNGTATQGKVID